MVIGIRFWGGRPQRPQEGPTGVLDELFPLPLSGYCGSMHGGGGSDGPVGTNTGFFRRERDLLAPLRERPHARGQPQQRARCRNATNFVRHVVSSLLASQPH